MIMRAVETVQIFNGCLMMPISQVNSKRGKLGLTTSIENVIAKRFIRQMTVPDYAYFKCLPMQCFPRCSDTGNHFIQVLL